MSSGMTWGPLGELTGVDLLSVGTRQLVPLTIFPGSADANMFPMFCYVVMRTRTGGALTTSPKFRIGGNGTHDDVAPIFTVPLATPLNVFQLLPLVAFPFTPVNLRTTPVVFEMTQAGIGPTACTGDVMLVGLQVSA
jgi:hypothetical protein